MDKQGWYNVAFCVALFILGAVFSDLMRSGSHKANGAAAYRAQLDADCRLVGFHRIGENVYLCSDVKAAQKEAVEQRDATVQGETE